MQGRICGSRRNRAFSSSMLRSVVVRWRSRVGQARRDGPTRPITTCDRGRGLCAPASQRNSRLRDLCCPIRWQLRLRRDAPLSRAELLRPYCLIHCSRRCGWLCSRLASPPTPRIKVDSTIHVHGPRTAHTVGTRLSTVCLPSAFCSLPVFTRAQSHQHNGRLRSDFWFTVFSLHHLDASCKRESRLLCRGTAEPPQPTVSPSVPSFRSQTRPKSCMTLL